MTPRRKHAEKKASPAEADAATLRPPRITLVMMRVRQADGATVRKVRLARGMTQADLAREAYTTQSYVANIESGYRRPSMDLASRIAGVLGVDLFAIRTPMGPEGDWEAAARGE